MNTHSEFKLPSYLNLEPKGDKIYIPYSTEYTRLPK